jgi:hypothetical protein
MHQAPFAHLTRYRAFHRPDIPFDLQYAGAAFG